MTFKEFKDLATNPPQRDEETIFVVTEYDVEPLPEHRRNHYPKFRVTEKCIGYSRDIDEGEAIIRDAINVASKWDTEIYCFHMREFPVGIPFYGCLGVSCRLYDSKGSFLDRTFSSDLDRDWHTKYGNFRGRTPEMQRFQAGDIVEVLCGDEVRLAVVAGPVITPEWCWERWNEIRTDERFRKSEGGDELTDDEIAKCYPLDDTDDQITVIDGPDYSWHDHVSPIFIMQLHYPLSKKLCTRYETYYNNK